MEEAENKREFYVLSSDVESDDEKNREKMKKSRHARAVKLIESSDTEKENALKCIKLEKFVGNSSPVVENASFTRMNDKTVTGNMYFLNSIKTS